MQNSKNLFLILSLCFFCTANHALAEPAAADVNVTEEQCNTAREMEPDRLRDPKNHSDWACLKKDADKDGSFEQYYVALNLIYGTSLEGKKNVPKGISLLVRTAKNGKDKVGAMRTLARTYWTGTTGVPKNIDLAYQWAFLAGVPIRETVVIRGDYYDEDMKKAAAQVPLKEQIEKIISPEQAEKLRKSAPELLK